jgi:hypothetical protein
MTNEEHNKYLAWTFIGHGAFQLFVTLLMFVVFAFAFTPGTTPPPMEFLLIIFGFMFMFQMLFVVPSFTAAYALLKRKSWARVAAIVAGVVSAMNVPLGTAACAYSLWFFLGDNWKDVYHPASRFGDTDVLASDPDPRQLAAREARWSGYHTDEQGEITFHTVEPPDWR